MNKPLVALGLIVLVVGLATTLETGTFHRKVVTYTQTWEGERDKVWEISGNFTTGDRLNLTITPATDWGTWSEPPGGDFTYPTVAVDVSIIDPNGGRTNFTFIFASIANPTTINPQLTSFGATPTSNNGGMSMEDENILVSKNQTIYYDGIKGIVNYNGIYKAIVIQRFADPPRYLKLFRQELAVEMPYLFVVPIGGMVIGSGVALSTWAARKSKHRTRQKIGKS